MNSATAPPVWLDTSVLVRSTTSCSCIQILIIRKQKHGFVHEPTVPKKLKQIFPEIKLRDFGFPSFYSHVSVSDLCIPTIGLPILLNCVCAPIVGIYTVNCLQIHECRNWERDHAVSFLGIFVSNFWDSTFVVFTSFL